MKRFVLSMALVLTLVFSVAMAQDQPVAGNAAPSIVVNVVPADQDVVAAQPSPSDQAYIVQPAPQDAAQPSVMEPTPSTEAAPASSDCGCASDCCNGRRLGSRRGYRSGRFFGRWRGGNCCCQ